MLYFCSCFLFILRALHDLELKNPKVLLNIPENNIKGKGNILKNHIPSSPDTTKYPHNNTSKDCLLRCEQDGENLDKILYDKSRVYIKTHDQNYHCFYQAVLTSLHQYIKHLEGFNKYTAIPNVATSIKQHTKHKIDEKNIWSCMV